MGHSGKMKALHHLHHSQINLEDHLKMQRILKEFITTEAVDW